MAACCEETIFPGSLLELSLDPGSRGQDIQRQEPGSHVGGHAAGALWGSAQGGE